MRINLILLSLFVFAGVCFGQDAREPLSDGFALSGVDGQVSFDQGRWWFSADEDVADERGLLAAGQRVRLLESSVLAQLAEDAENRKAHRYRLWGLVTRYGGENFVFLSYFLPVRRAVEPDDGDQQDPTDDDEQADDDERGRPGDQLRLPDEIMEQFERQRAIETPDEPTLGSYDVQVGDDRMLAGRSGVLEVVEGKVRFTIHGLSMTGSVGAGYELLPNAALERAQRQLSRPGRFEVVGLVTEFDGKEYMLLVRARPIYGFGNFEL